MDTYVKLEDVYAILNRLQSKAVDYEDISKVTAYVNVKYELDSISKYWI